MTGNLFQNLFRAIRGRRHFAAKAVIPVIMAASLLAGCYEKATDLATGEHGKGDLIISAGEHKTRVLDGRSKNRSPDFPKEYVVIGSDRYEVGEPWLGHRIVVEQNPRNLELVMLPRKYGEEEREIYVTRETRDAFVKMAEAALQDGVILKVDSGYRSFSYQEQIYKKKLVEGQTFHDISRWVAPPGYSEHILGTTLDLTPSNWTFSKTAAEKWLLKNGGRFSFRQSYPRISRKGFAWEPWHWKYSEQG
ncbi:MAG: D-alanyl-D-alanine carboxypeptidase family protein [Proteobacteria bacterium]|nr:D-alanyl-D-alanine carboxypeptidase family protein [Pseudomonadota bacterium]MBU1736663.1 D-alanyl-D-alanine carboxypeptidase family protein [Pseudomonadota bacterium]